MFYSQYILAKKGALGKVWLAAHWDKKLTKQAINQTDLEDTVKNIVEPTTPIALRTSGHLLLGVVRIYSRKTHYLWVDVSDALVKIKTAIKPGSGANTLKSGSSASLSVTQGSDGGAGITTNVDLPVKAGVLNAITLADNFNDIDLDVPDIANIAMSTTTVAISEQHLMMNIARHEDITLLDKDFNLYKHQKVLGMDANRDSFGGFMAHNDISIEVGRDAGPDISFRPSDYSEINMKDNAMQVDMSMERYRGSTMGDDNSNTIVDDDDFNSGGIRDQEEDVFGMNDVFNSNNSMEADGLNHNLEISNIEIPDMRQDQYDNDGNVDESNIALPNITSSTAGDGITMSSLLKPMEAAVNDNDLQSSAKHAQRQQLLAKKMKRQYFDVDIEIDAKEYKKQLKDTSDLVLSNNDDESVYHWSKKSKMDIGFLFSRPSTLGMPSQLYYLFNRDPSSLPEYTATSTTLDNNNVSGLDANGNEVSIPDISDGVGLGEMDLPTVDDEQVDYPDYQDNDYEHQHNNESASTGFDFSLTQASQQQGEHSEIVAKKVSNTADSERTVRMLNSLNQTFQSQNTTKLSLNAILNGKSKKTAAACFFEILTLKTRNQIDVKQNAPFGDITIIQRDLENTSIASATKVTHTTA